MGHHQPFVTTDAISPGRVRRGLSRLFSRDGCPVCPGARVRPARGMYPNAAQTILPIGPGKVSGNSSPGNPQEREGPAPHTCPVCHDLPGS
jgi:hypothetical protein